MSEKGAGTKDKADADDVEVRVREGKDVETLRQIEVRWPSESTLTAQTKKLTWQQATFLLMGEVRRRSSTSLTSRSTS